jgi:hypothetical protein
MTVLEYTLIWLLIGTFSVLYAVIDDEEGWRAGGHPMRTFLQALATGAFGLITMCIVVVLVRHVRSIRNS